MAGSQTSGLLDLTERYCADCRSLAFVPARKVVLDMRQAFRLIITMAALMVVFVLGCDAAERSTPGAFVPYKSSSVQELVSQIAVNQRALARYANHYGMSPEAVLKYFKENLVLTTLKKPYNGQVFYVSTRGSVLSKPRSLPAGTRVFATPEGIPILEWRCSNPISKSLPARQAIKPKPKPEPVKVEVKPSPPIEIVQPQITTLVTTIEPVATPIVAVAPPIISASPSISIPEIFATAFVPALLGAFAVHESAPPPNVPEPASLAGLGLGLGGLILGYRRRFKA